ncbi:type II secretion system protein F [Marinobacterium iners]|jgi:type IV pilus assembly protein PilC|uniref:type II secretion system F family protein n=1 Tax=Marinobacterium TaxID=48075 RepID=UPI001A8F2AE2|nr:type II secretion system F family protein [Marinobacterium iners]QSR36059.1 type II secretion system protein F [Marinobacterium iners]
MAKALSRKQQQEEVKNTYVWQGRDKSGNISKGKIDAVNLAKAKSLLRHQGVNPHKIHKEGMGLFGSKSKPIKPVDIAYLIRQLATMMRAGVPLLQALDLVSNGADKFKLKKLIQTVRSDVNSGTDFASALARHPDYFDDLVCSLVQAGEQSGALETMLDRIATYKEKTESLKKKIKKAMTYPIAVIVVGVIVSAILLVKVVPQFDSIFRGFGADLPAFTQLVVNMSEWMQKWWFVVLLIIVASVFFFAKLHARSEKFSNLVDRSILRLPVFGGILHKAAVARFARTLATTFAAGVPLVEALNSAAGSTGNVVYSDAIKQIRNGVSTGQSLTNATTMTGIFPVMVIQMLSIGEEAGSLDHMLDKIATFYEEDVDNAVDNLSSLLEPMIMVILGVLVGGLVIAMYLPIFQLGQVVG